jgi:hypothetical protein
MFEPILVCIVFNAAITDRPSRPGEYSDNSGHAVTLRLT